MGQMVIAAYRPRAGRERQLLELVNGHAGRLRELGLATQRPAVVMRASDGTLLEVFEWVSAAAVEEAHGDDAVQEMWNRFAEVCEYVSLDSLEEARKPFPHFEPVDP